MKIAIVAALLAALAAPAAAWPGRKVHRYKIVTGDGSESILYAEKIRTRGFCVELILGGRVDTIACGIKYITEVPDEKPTADPEPEPTPAPSKPSSVARGMSR